MFQHTAARRRLQEQLKTKADPILVSTHSRAEAAAKDSLIQRAKAHVSTHSRAEAAAKLKFNSFSLIVKFQHTAARRRLLPT